MVVETSRYLIGDQINVFGGVFLSPKVFMPEMDARWFNYPPGNDVFYIFFDLPISKQICDEYKLPPNLDRMCFMDLMPESSVPMENQSIVARSPFVKDKRDLLGIPSNFYMSEMDGDDLTISFADRSAIPHQYVNNGISDVLDVILGEHDFSREWTNQILQDVVKDPKKKRILTVFIHGTITSLNDDQTFLVSGPANGVMDVFELLSRLPDAVKEVGLNLEKDVSLVHLRACNSRILKGEKLVEDVDFIQAFLKNNMKHTQRMSLQMGKKSGCRFVSATRYNNRCESGGKWLQREQIRILANPLSVPLSFALDKIKGGHTRGRAFVFPDGRAEIGP